MIPHTIAKLSAVVIFVFAALVNLAIKGFFTEVKDFDWWLTAFITIFSFAICGWLLEGLLPKRWEYRKIASMARKNEAAVKAHETHARGWEAIARELESLGRDAEARNAAAVAQSNKTMADLLESMLPSLKTKDRQAVACIAKSVIHVAETGASNYQDMAREWQSIPEYEILVCKAENEAREWQALAKDFHVLAQESWIKL